jgi:hypothetical protein
MLNYYRDFFILNIIVSITKILPLNLNHALRASELYNKFTAPFPS